MDNAMIFNVSATVSPVCPSQPEKAVQCLPGNAPAVFRKTHEGASSAYDAAEQLRVRAFQFEEIVERRLIDANGIPRSALIRGTMKPFPEGYFAGCFYFLPHCWSGNNEGYRLEWF